MHPEQLLCDRLKIRIDNVVIALEFGRGLEGLAKEMRVLWRHLVVPQKDVSAHARRTYVSERTSQLPHGVPLRWVSGSSYMLSKQITKILIENLIGARILLHAGFIDHNRFGGVMVVGASGAGKSTATTFLGQNGKYLTDELVIVDPESLRVIPFPKPVSRIPPGALPSAKRDVALADLGLEAANHSPSIQHVVFLEREHTSESSVVGVPEIRRLSLAEALCQIIEQSSSLWKVEDGLVQLATLISGAGGAVRAHYREAEQLPSLLDRLPAPRSEAWVRIEYCSRGIANVGEYSVVPYAQALGLDDGVIVLFERRALYLSGLSAVVWKVLNERGADTEYNVERAVIHSLGAYGNSGQLVRDALRILVQGGAALKRSA